MPSFLKLGCRPWHLLIEPNPYVIENTGISEGFLLPRYIYWHSQYNNLECPIKNKQNKNKNNTGVLTTRQLEIWPEKTAVADDKYCKSCEKTLKTVSEITNKLCKTGVKISQLTIQRRLGQKKYRPLHRIQTTHQQ